MTTTTDTLSQTEGHIAYAFEALDALEQAVASGASAEDIAFEFKLARGRLAHVGNMARLFADLDAGTFSPGAARYYRSR